MQQILDIRNQFLVFAQTITGLTHKDIQLLLIVIVAYIVALFLFVAINKKTKKALVVLEKKLQAEYDNIWYLLSKFQYSNNQENKPNYGLRDLFKLQKMTYLPNHNDIKAGVKWFEGYVNQIVIADQIWDSLEKTIKKFKLKNKFHKLTTLFLTVITLWVYRLFS